MVFSEKREKSERHGAGHSIESALINASNKGYTIDMILGTHDRKPKQESNFEEDGKLSGNPSDDEGTAIK